MKINNLSENYKRPSCSVMIQIIWNRWSSNAKAISLHLQSSIPWSLNDNSHKLKRPCRVKICSSSAKLHSPKPNDKSHKLKRPCRVESKLQIYIYLFIYFWQSCNHSTSSSSLNYMKLRWYLFFKINIKCNLLLDGLFLFFQLITYFLIFF